MRRLLSTLLILPAFFSFLPLPAMSSEFGPPNPTLHEMYEDADLIVVATIDDDYLQLVRRKEEQEEKRYAQLKEDDAETEETPEAQESEEVDEGQDAEEAKETEDESEENEDESEAAEPGEPEIQIPSVAPLKIDEIIKGVPESNVNIFFSSFDFSINFRRDAEVKYKERSKRRLLILKK